MISKGNIAMAFVLIASVALAGGGESHGTDYDKDQHNPWFLGEAPIPYCIEVWDSNLYGGTLGEYRTLIENSFQEWRSFFRKYGFDQLRWGENTNRTFLDRKARGLSVNAHFISTCHEPQKQLRFVFFDEENKRKTPLSDHTLGAAIRGPYDHRQYRTGGTIWIRLTVRGEKQLKSLLVHELGHVFGMPHDSVFAMREKGALDITLSEPDYSEYWGQIESAYWKYKLKPNDQLDLHYAASTRHPDQLPNWRPPLPEIFLKGLNGRAQNYVYEGKLKAGYYQTSVTYLGLRNGKKLFALTIADGEGKANRYEGEFDSALGAPSSDDYAYFTDKAYAGPALYTNWLLVPPRFPKDSSAFRWYLEEQQPKRDLSQDYVFAIPAHGSFKMGDQIIPAVIENGRSGGAVLKIFLAETNEWVLFSGISERTNGTNRWDW